MLASHIHPAGAAFNHANLESLYIFVQGGAQLANGIATVPLGAHAPPSKAAPASQAPTGTNGAQARGLSESAAHAASHPVADAHVTVQSERQGQHLPDSLVSPCLMKGEQHRAGVSCSQFIGMHAYSLHEISALS